ncbi:MAG: heme-binding domain-containing protein [Bryobacteraceae bacterium]|nr:heme-binding domain-containing protein [Bryobacteraceae bacterium]
MKLLAGGVLLLFAGMQFVQPFERTNPASDPGHDIHAVMAIPPAVDRILDKACVNCHSNRTEWPVWGKIAPTSWLVTKDVLDGRKVFNFSEWKPLTEKKPAVAATMLMSGCAGIQSGTMPKAGYLLTHPDAKLNAAETQLFCGWAKQEAKALLRAKRRG